MSNIAIKIENLGKRYQYGGAESVSYNLRQDLMDWARGVFRRNRGQQSAVSGQPGGPRSVVAAAVDVQPPATDLRPPTSETHPTLHQIHEKHLDADPNYFWALKDINLEINQGETVGIIGRNGAGKSTLLKILSRITPPTTGKITYNGRIASLLEVGTGFHRELTGRENIFLNGSILGMKRTEITKKFDEIVAFAEVDKFIDTPVKFYSSGMYVRLAFAVAAHLEPEILVIDEVLAVGDASFQKKCLGKMGDVAKEGRTVLFVSHNMMAVQSLCSKSVWLDCGSIKMIGSPAQVTSEYLRAGQEMSLTKSWADLPTAPGTDLCRIRSLKVTTEDGPVPNEIAMVTPCRNETEYEVLQSQIPVCLTFHIVNEQGIVAFTTSNVHALNTSGDGSQAGIYRNVCHIPGNLLNSGIHYLKVLLVRNRAKVFYSNDALLSFAVVDSTPRAVGWHGKEPGVVQPTLAWETEYSSADSSNFSQPIVHR